jgi:hypothetical protein
MYCTARSHYSILFCFLLVTGSTGNPWPLAPGRGPFAPQRPQQEGGNAVPSPPSANETLGFRELGQYNVLCQQGHDIFSRLVDEIFAFPRQ